MANNGAEVSDIVAHWIGIGQKDIQVDGADKGIAWELTQIQIKCASQLSEGVGEKAFYLGIWEAENAAEGPYSRIAVSTNAVQQKAGQLGNWKFEKTVIHHRNIRLAFIETQDGIWPSENWHLIGVRQADRTNDTGNYTGVQNVNGTFDKTHVPIVTLQYANLKSKTSSDQLTEAEVAKVKSIIKTPLVIGEGEAIYGSGGEGTHKSQRDVWLVESATTISNPQIYSGLGPFVIGGADITLNGQFETFIVGQNSTVNTGNYNGVDGFGLIGSGSLIVNSVKGFVATGANTTMTVGNGGISGIVCISNRDPSQNPNEFALNLSSNSNDTYARPNGVIIGGENTRVHASDNLENKGVFILGENGSVNADNIMPTNSGVSILGNQTSKNIGSYGYNNGVIIVGGGEDILNVDGILQNNGIVIYGKTTTGSSYIHFGTDSNTIFYGNIVDKNGTKILDNGVFQGGGSSIDLPAGNNFTQPVLGERATSTGDTNIVIGQSADANGEYCVSIGYNTEFSGSQNNCISIGHNTFVSGNAAIAIGPQAGSSAENTISIGSYAAAQSNSSIAIGTSTKAGAENAIAIGNTATTSNYNNDIAIGYNAHTEKSTYNNGGDSLAIGTNAKAISSNSIAIGHGANSDQTSIAIGDQANSDQGGIAIGVQTNASGGLACGSNTKANAPYAISIGDNAEANISFSVAIGYNAYAEGDDAVAIGNYAYNKNSGVLVLAAGGEGGPDQLQLYLITPHSTLSQTYCTGKAAIGYIYRDKQGSGGITQSGWIALDELCTHTPFTPDIS